MDVELDEIQQWSKLRKKLVKDYSFNSHWDDAIKLIKKRFKRKFFDSLEHLIKEKTRKGEGFTIVTVQCALIETFASLRTGQIFMHSKPKNSPSYYYISSMGIFTKFLTTAPIFKDIFWTIKNGTPQANVPFDSVSFYKNVRCGLMHEARTKEKWFINTAPKETGIKTDKIFIVKDGDKLKIYRSILHYRLKKYLADYCDDLQKDTKDGKTLRRFFARKMDHIFEETPDPNNFEWWNG